MQVTDEKLSACDRSLRMEDRNKVLSRPKLHTVCRHTVFLFQVWRRTLLLLWRGCLDSFRSTCVCPTGETPTSASGNKPNKMRSSPSCRTASDTRTKVRRPQTFRTEKMFLFYFLGHLTNPPLRTQQLKKKLLNYWCLCFIRTLLCCVQMKRSSRAAWWRLKQTLEKRQGWESALISVACFSTAHSSSVSSCCSSVSS